MPNDYIAPVCSNRPRPRTQRGAKGHAGWDRDTYHANKQDQVTFCGRDARDWLKMDRMPTVQAKADPNFCVLCAAVLK